MSTICWVVCQPDGIKRRQWSHNDGDSLRWGGVIEHPGGTTTDLYEGCASLKRIQIVPAPGGVCDGSRQYAYDSTQEDGRGAKLFVPCQGCRACC